ncbi:hypothetical protein N7510_009476 [Penicillium lagena]|uniref:uncharacterized protein n=1 Tax=Penicillium lagena TaxID=94218 RepID=UPI00253F9A8D|nr:uncharacterized protein N7510_009476 [Penicillium lagena]KAJ5606695.1 hypothetical protein N7510_009476 [Penicillium lagena]
MSTSQIVLILGAGPRSLLHREKAVELGLSRVIFLHADFAKPGSIPELFDAVKAEFNAAPNVVVYNAASLTPPADKESALSIPADRVTSDLNVNTVSPYVAAQQAIMEWNIMSDETKKSFIYTGNVMNVSVVPVPLMLDLGMGKAASAFWIGVADQTYSARGFRFFYADERHEDGKFKGMALDGAAHGAFYPQLASHEGNVPWHATFVKGKGYVQFK